MAARNAILCRTWFLVGENLKRALEQKAQDKSWELQLAKHDDWRDRLSDHFRSIFKKQDRETVDYNIGSIVHCLTVACKHCAWRPFDPEELKALRKRWKNGKACGLDQVSHEALKTLKSDERWNPKLFSDVLYTCKIPETVERGITILLAKAKVVNDSALSL